MTTRRAEPDLAATHPQMELLDEHVEELLDEQEEERLRRLENDPFSFPDRDAFLRFRRSRGL